jgi:two-component system, LuxR family, response regulator FixJ
MTNEILIVDDDYHIHEALTLLFEKAGYRTVSFTDSRSFVRHARERTPACVLLDIRMPGASGLEILEEIDAKAYPAPVLILSGQGDIPDVVRAMRNGAFDYIEKCLSADTIVARVGEAISTWTRLRQNDEPTSLLSPTIPGYSELTHRERDVLRQIAAAASNKEAARNLGISHRTVEIHRGRIMYKLRAKNSVDLMRIVMRAGREA